MADPTDTPDDLYGDPDIDDTEEPDDAQPWLDLITDHDKAGYKDYQTRGDKIDKLFADGERLASTTRDAEFQIFWANLEVLKPSIYSRPPIPVVVPRFRDRKPLPRTAAEFLERAIVVTFDDARIDRTMRMVRDDLAVLARGVAWLRYESDDDGEEVCIEWVSRRDFAHDPARTWSEVDWVAKRSWLTKTEAKKRFQPTSGDLYKDAAYEIRKDQNQNDDGKLKAGIWELWCKSADRVVWVTQGCEKVLDSGKPHLDLEDFYPCPEPAYGTRQRGSLVPVPDFVYYQDQVSEINALTNRISALSDSLILKGFYPSGAGELGDAIEAALKNSNPNVHLVGIANWAMLGGQSADKMIVWLPMEMVAATITQLVQLRKQLIDDVYQVTGLSDIMRGQTDPNETLGAQEIKTQYGSVRVKDRQAELVRFAKDITRLTAEIMAENFSKNTLLEMTQLDIATTAHVTEQVKQLTAQKQQIAALMQKIQTDPQLQQKVQQLAQQNPDQAKQVMQKVQDQMQQIDGQIGKLQQTVTIEQVMGFIKDQRVRPFVLDIETDSTIAPDENAQKQRATEFVTATGGFMGQVIPLVKELPQAAPLAAEFLKYVAGQFRAGRELEGVVDDFADQMAQAANQAPPVDPAQQAEQQKAKTAQLLAKSKLDAAQLDAQLKQQTEQRAVAVHTNAVQLAQQESSAKIEATKLGMAQAAQKHQQDMQKGALEIEALKAKTAQALAQGAQGPEATPAKPPSESIAFGDLPPEGQSQMAAQAGIHLTPAAMAAHTAQQDAKDAAAMKAKLAAKPKPAAPPA